MKKLTINHLGTVNIETERLILRKFKKNDYIDMYNNWASREEVAKYMPWSAHKDINLTKELVSGWINEYKNNDTYNWVIELKENHKIIGNISVTKKNDAIYCCEIGYCLSSDYWGKGYMPEAMRGVLDFLFMKVNYNRIECYHKVENINSGKVMEKVGMKCEGLLRDRGLKNDGSVCDSKIWSILKREYIKLKEQK